MTLRQIATISLIAFSLSACEAVKTTLTDWDQAINGAVNGDAPAAAPPAPRTQTAAKPAPPPRKAAQTKAAAKTPDSRTAMETGQSTAPPATAALAAPAQPVGPVRLIGLSTGETTSLFGRPESEREASPGKIWHYSSGACSLDVHFFFDVSRNDFYALDYKAKGDDAEACLSRLRKPAAKS